MVPVSPASKPLTILKFSDTVAVGPEALPVPVKSAVKPPRLGRNVNWTLPPLILTVGNPLKSTFALSLMSNAPNVVSVPEPEKVSLIDGNDPLALAVPENVPPKFTVEALAICVKARTANAAPESSSADFFIECPLTPRIAPRKILAARDAPSRYFATRKSQRMSFDTPRYEFFKR